MDKLIPFITEHTLVNSAPIFLASGVIALILGGFLSGLGAGNWTKIIIYSIAGVIGGVWAYSSMTIPERSLEVMEGLSLITGMLIYSLIVTSIVVFTKSAIKNRKHKI